MRTALLVLLLLWQFISCRHCCCQQCGNKVLTSKHPGPTAARLRWQIPMFCLHRAASRLSPCRRRRLRRFDSSQRSSLRLNQSPRITLNLLLRASLVRILIKTRDLQNSFKPITKCRFVCTRLKAIQRNTNK